ncbi:MAG: DUF371 domain-containing protein [Candidatus Bathyarchaeum sp.]|nr:MAG: DUF371 domain-containing protein [Candidatus Bathyarchaeum sp.]
MNVVTVVFSARGHENVLATHKTTVEVTKEKTLSKRGNCILAVESGKAAVDLPLEFKKAARKEDTQITITVEADELKETIKAKGSPKLQFTHPTDLVIRKSDYVCGRTLAISADKASVDFSRDFVEKLKDPNQTVKVTVTAQSY